MSGFTPTNHEARLARQARHIHCAWRRIAEYKPGLIVGNTNTLGMRWDTIWALSHLCHERRAG